MNVTIVLALVLMWRLRAHADRRVLEGPVGTFVFIAFLQAAIGYTQYLTGVPVVLVISHVAGATALWLAALHLARSTAGASDSGPTGRDVSVVEPVITAG